MFSITFGISLNVKYGGIKRESQVRVNSILVELAFKVYSFIQSTTQKYLLSTYYMLSTV